MLELHGWDGLGDKLRALVRQGDPGAMAAVVPDEILDEFCGGMTCLRWRPCSTGRRRWRPPGSGRHAGAVRISLGSVIAQAAYGVAARAAAELLSSETYDADAGGIAYDTLNAAVTPRLPC